MRISIINGPNLNLLGKREPEIYGTQDFETYFRALRELFPGIELDFFQSNHEGALIDEIQRRGFEESGLILNAAAYTHTSIAIADAVKAIPAPVVEVHISDISQRESFRQHSYLEDVCVASISGYGLKGYQMAVEWFIANTSRD